jgi:hypothetical protein
MCICGPYFNLLYSLPKYNSWYYYNHKILDIQTSVTFKKITLNHALLKLSHER